MSYGDLEEREDGHILIPLSDPERTSEDMVYARLLFDETGIGIYVHKSKPKPFGYNGQGVDRSQVMCTFYLEFYEGKVQAQLYDEVGEQHDEIHYEFGGENESIVLVGNVEQWKPETRENDEEGVS